MVKNCTLGRRAPRLPSVLKEELESKHFTNGKDDRPAVAMLYAKSFAARFDVVDALTYSELGCGDAEAKAVAALLAAGATPKLEALILSDNSIGDEGARALAKALRGAPTLVTLYLDGNSIGDEGARALAKALHSAPTLETLYLDGNSIGDKGAHALAKALPNAPALHTLTLYKNSISAKAESELRRACKGRSCELNLSL
jgi:Leucine-rich repeat (LRR) protein